MKLKSETLRRRPTLQSKMGVNSPALVPGVMAQTVAAK